MCGYQCQSAIQAAIVLLLLLTFLWYLWYLGLFSLILRSVYGLLRIMKRLIGLFRG